MGELLTLVMLSLAMLVGCYVSGLIPLVVTFSEEYMKLTTVLGAGLLIGTALAVIIPEGVHTVYSAATHTVHSHAEAVVKAADTGVVAAAAGIEDAGHAHHDEHEHEHTELHTLIGISLLLGFIFMLLVDQLCGGGHSHSHSAAPAVDSESGKSNSAQPQNRHKITATLGLVVHAAADGVALGAAASTSQTHIEMIVFVAIMLHKAPAAFGLTSFLLHEGHDKRKVKSHLAAFAVSAPIAAVITYFGLSQQSKEVLNTINATGIAMLFSAGTFLYVATVHVLPEIANIGQGQEQSKGFSKKELAAMVIGALLPACLSLGHHH